jgi:hypothetical protein
MKVKIVALVALSLAASLTSAEQHEIVWSDQERPIADQIRSIRKVPDDVRGSTTKALAMQIRELPATPNKLQLAMGLAGRATEGDFGRDTLQEVATTLELAIKEEAPKEQDRYTELASLVRYEHVNTALDSPQYSAAMARLESEDRERRASRLQAQRPQRTLVESEGCAWQSRDAELLGHTVPTLPQRNARLGGAISTFPIAGLGDSGSF